ncbi:MAG: thermonuclease family protein [Nitrospirae bacterium]|nr:thermonuclease family protein [Nitrospirota bacterium]
MKRFFCTRFFLLLLYVLCFISISEAVQPGSYRVTEVNDGDTVTIRTSSFIGIPFKTERVRLIGIDAPELKQENWGRKSKRYLKKLISDNDWVVRLELDVDQRDKYGRLLGYLWDNRGRMINELMVEHGHALLYTIPPNVKYDERFITAQKRAQSKKVGVWHKGGLQKSPHQWREEHPR